MQLNFCRMRLAGFLGGETGDGEGGRRREDRKQPCDPISTKNLATHLPFEVVVTD